MLGQFRLSSIPSIEMRPDKLIGLSQFDFCADNQFLFLLKRKALVPFEFHQLKPVASIAKERTLSLEWRDCVHLDHSKRFLIEELVINFAQIQQVLIAKFLFSSWFAICFTT